MVAQGTGTRWELSGIRPTSPQNAFDLSAERGLSSFDQRHSFTADYLWELPFGHERRWLWARLRCALSWETGIGAATGPSRQEFPSTPRVLGNTFECEPEALTARSGRMWCPASLVTGAWPLHRASGLTRPRSWPPSGVFGDAHRNSIEGPGSRLFDMSFTKIFPLSKTRFPGVPGTVLECLQYASICRDRYCRKFSYLRAGDFGGADAVSAADSEVQVLMRRDIHRARRVHRRTGEDAGSSIVAFVLVIVMLCTSVNSQESSSTEYTFRSRTELVLVNVTVRDKNGNPVRDLKREDFTLLEDNKPQQVISFDLENTDAVLSTAATEAALLRPAPTKSPDAASALATRPLKDRGSSFCSSTSAPCSRMKLTRPPPRRRTMWTSKWCLPTWSP